MLDLVTIPRYRGICFPSSSIRWGSGTSVTPKRWGGLGGGTVASGVVGAPATEFNGRVMGPCGYGQFLEADSPSVKVLGEVRGRPPVLRSLSLARRWMAPRLLGGAGGGHGHGSGSRAASSREPSRQHPPDRRGAVQRRRLALVGGRVPSVSSSEAAMLAASSAAPRVPGATTERRGQPYAVARDRDGEAARQQGRHERRAKRPAEDRIGTKSGRAMSIAASWSTRAGDALPATSGIRTTVRRSPSTRPPAQARRGRRSAA